jgi:hypothetical protein
MLSTLVATRNKNYCSQADVVFVVTLQILSVNFSAKSELHQGYRQYVAILLGAIPKVSLNLNQRLLRSSLNSAAAN